MDQFDEIFDVVVIGSGIAGLSAAIEAKTAGASVLVLEKMKITGGNTRISDGCFAACNNYLQEEKGIPDSPRLFFEDMMRAGQYLNRPELVRIVVENSADAIDWTCSVLGVKYLDRVDRFGGHSAERCLTTRGHSGRDVVKALVAKASALGIEIRTQCLLAGLVTDETGSVIGVDIREDYRFQESDSGVEKKIRAKNGVILATGGFGSDVQFRSYLNPTLDDTIQTTNHKGATAEGLCTAMALNAFPLHLSRIQLGPWGCPDEKGYGKGGRFASYCVFPLGILVDPATGRRIVNEWGNRKQRADAIMKTGRPCIGIVDAKGAARTPNSLAHCLKTGKVKAFDTIAGLETGLDMPAASLETTLADYHAAIGRGDTDRFGKSLDSSTPKLTTPPFYAIRLWPKIHYTPGGLGIDTQARVLDLNQNPIPGLFAAGEICGGIHGASRLGACALTESLVFGRIAGKQAAARLRA